MLTDVKPGGSWKKCKIHIFFTLLLIENCIIHVKFKKLKMSHDATFSGGMI